ncbi:zwei Ig domain protein zig-8-like [Palaemon carinicauda]|uniref:zwei Ig domain protein zig-8-like n=1 Tax=Palaemon carinicauda TaxID=392227 RepID=UPI0035B6A216
MTSLRIIVIAFVVFVQYLGVSGRHHDFLTFRKHRRRELIIGPRNINHDYITIEQQNNTQVTTQVGGTATLKCYTHFLGDEMVIWLKKDEDHLLTAGGQVYSSESRYSVAHVRHQKLWELSVREVKKSDAGLYECQLTTHPPTSLFFTLNVVEAHAEIQGAPEVHVHTGNRLRLHCSVKQATEPPTYIFWFHNDTMINYESNRPMKVIKHRFGSTLVIANVTWDDAGTYRCEPYKAIPTNVTLHVLAGEKHAALHEGQDEGGGDEEKANPATSSSSSSSSSWKDLHLTSSPLLVSVFLSLHFTFSSSSWPIIFSRTRWHW